MKVLRSVHMKVWSMAILLVVCKGAFAQYVPPAPPAGPAICAWPSVPLRTYPGREAGVLIEAIYFGEQVEIVGPREYIEEERRYYVLVTTSENKQGWVHEHLFVSGGKLAVMLAGANLYKKPGAPATISETPLSPGEIVIAAQSSGSWLMLCTSEKAKSGWIDHSAPLLSDNPRDVELATLYVQAHKERDAQVYARKMDQVLTMARAAGSPLLGVWELSPNERYTSVLSTQSPSLSTSRSAIPAGGTWTNPTPTQPVTPPTTPAYIPSATTLNQASSRVADPTEWESPSQAVSGTLLQETGGMADIMEPKAGDLFRVYHKYLPAGTQVKLFLPNNQGALNLVVAGRLPAGTPAIIGLPVETRKTIFGDQVPQVVTIQYTATGQ